MPSPTLPTLDLFGEPDINSLKPLISKIKEKKLKSSISKKSEDIELKSASITRKIAEKVPDKNINQGFLPGLSRRGRPRSKNPITAVARTAEHRRKRLAEGSKRVEMILPPEVARQLDALADQFKEPRSEVIATLVIKAYAKVFKTKPSTTK
jgi:hypothetical protein